MSQHDCFQLSSADPMSVGPISKPRTLPILAGVDTLEARRDQLTERFFTRSVLPESSRLHYLLPDKRDTSVTGAKLGLFSHCHVEL